MNTQFDTATLKAIIQEGRRLGYNDTLIASKLGIAADEVARHIEGKSTKPAHPDAAQAVRDVRATMQANGFACPEQIEPGTVAWAGDTWVLLFSDLSGFAVSKNGDDLVYSGRIDCNSDIKSIESRAERAAYFVRGQIGAGNIAMMGILSRSRSLGCELSGIAEGFFENQFFGLDETLKRQILILIARTNEATYRRGLQQGWWARDTNQKFRIKPDDLRWGSEPLDSARMSLCGTRMTSLERLQIQHGFILQALGLDVGDLQ